VSRLARWWCAAVVALLAAAPLAWAQSEERIVDYAIEVDVRTDGSLDVAEHITVRAEGERIRRGIYRDFPTRYRDRYGNNVVVDLDVLGVERDGAPEPWFTEGMLNGVRINTGNDDFLPRFPADYRFTLRYRTTRQLGFFVEHDELYWNAIGTGWDFAIDAGRVEVRLPAPVPVAQMEAEGYTGPQGAQGQAYTASIVEPGVARWQLSSPLAPREGFTIVLSFPKGIVAAPMQTERIGWLLKDNRGVLVAVAGFVLLLVYCVRRWHSVGRDPRAGVIIARYEPPEGRSPAELRYLKRRRYDMRCFTSDLLTSAVNGQVQIERDRRILRGDRWRLSQVAGDATASYPTVAALVGRLFTGAAGSIELVKTNAHRLQSARQAHSKALSARLHGSHFQRNAGSAVAAFAIAIATVVLAFGVSGGGGVLAIGVLCVLMAIVVIAFIGLVQAPTAEGRRLINEIEGLKLYLSVAERDELASIEGPGGPPPLDARRYEELLPYAVALDVEEAWTKKFTAAVGAAAAAAATAGIAWYRGGGVDDLGGLAKAVGSGLNASIASASTPPGSSSGGGGGGSSGGGGGGGGGGGR
jgi:hypothetical protein